jgi:uncharacterized protein YjiK
MTGASQRRREVVLLGSSRTHMGYRRARSSEESRRKLGARADDCVSSIADATATLRALVLSHESSRVQQLSEAGM